MSSGGGIEIPVSFEAEGSQVTLEKLAAQVQELDKATGDLSKRTKTASDDFSKIAKNAASFAAGIFSIGAAVKFVTSSIAAQSAQIDAVNKLNLALANQGELTAEVSQDLQDYAASLQETSLFGDEAVIGLQAQLTTFGLVGEELKRATTATLDFAQATGRNLREAGTAVGKAFAGQFEVLRELGVEIDRSVDRSQQFDQALGELEGRFSGAAQAATQTFTGGLTQLQNAFGDTQEAFGKFLGFLTGQGGTAFAGLTSLVQFLTKLFGQDLIIALSEAQALFAEFIAGTLSGIAALAEQINRLPGVDIDTTELRLSAEDQRSFAAELRATGDAAATTVGQTAEFTNALKDNGAAAALTAKEQAELEKRLKAVAAAQNSLTGALDPEKFAIVAEALEGIGDAALIAEKQIPKLAQQLLQAEQQGLELPAVADAIVDRFLEMEVAAASVEVLNTALEEQAATLELLGPGVEGIAESLLDLQSAIGAQGGLELLDNAELLAAIEGLDAVAVEAEAAGVEIEGLGETFISALAEASARGIDLSEAVTQVGDDTEAVTDRSSTAFDQLGETMQGVEALFNQLGIAADSFGGTLLSVLTALPSAFGTVTEGLGSLFDGLGGDAAEGLLGSLTGVLGNIGIAGQVATAAVGIGSAIVGLFKSDPVERAQDEAGEILGVGISRSLAESIADQADELGIAVADAALLSIPDAIAESGEAASTFAGEILTLFDAVADGTVPAAEGIASLGESFGAVADEALEAGRVGDVALRALIRRSRELGQEVPQITAFVNQQLDVATAGLGRFVDALGSVSDEAFSTLGEDAAVVFGATFDALVSERGLVGAVDALEGQFGGLRERLEETLGEEAARQLTAPFAAAFDLLGNEELRPLVDGIDGLSQTFSALANADFLNLDQFRAAERASATLFDELIAGGADTNTALTAIAPSIQSAIAAAEQFSIPISEDTQRLRELAEQNGITFATDPQEAVLDVLVEIAKVLGADIPASAQAATQAVQSLAGAAQGADQAFAQDPFALQTGGVAGAPFVSNLPGQPGQGQPGGQGQQVQNIEFNVSVAIDENPLAAAETREQIRRQTVNDRDQLPRGPGGVHRGGPGGVVNPALQQKLDQGARVFPVLKVEWESRGLDLGTDYFAPGGIVLPDVPLRAKAAAGGWGPIRIGPGVRGSSLTTTRTTVRIEDVSEELSQLLAKYDPKESPAEISAGALGLVEADWDKRLVGTVEDWRSQGAGAPGHRDQDGRGPAQEPGPEASVHPGRLADRCRLGHLRNLDPAAPGHP